MRSATAAHPTATVSTRVADPGSLATPPRPRLPRLWSLGRGSFADATVVVSQEDSSAALQRIRRLLVQVRDGSRVLEDFVTHDKFWIGRRCCLESEDLGAARGELPAGRPREVEVQERANCLDVVPLPRAIGLISTNGHSDALRFPPHRARAAFRARSRRALGLAKLEALHHADAAATRMVVPISQARA